MTEPGATHMFTGDDASAFNLRRLTAADALMWRTFRLEGLQSHPEAFGAVYDDEAVRPLERWASGLEQTDFTVFAAFRGTDIAASVGLGLGGNAKTAHKAGIYAVYTRPTYRGLGLCARLLAMALDVARKHGRTSFRLSVAQSNVEARRIYERMGFTAYGTEPIATIVNGNPVALVLMGLDDLSSNQ